jgi:hypothetical protein
MAYQYRVSRDLIENKRKLPSFYKPPLRFMSLYCVSLSCILIWRGTWMLWDQAYEYWLHEYRNHDTATSSTNVTASMNNNSTDSIKSESDVVSNDNHDRVKATHPIHSTTSGIASHIIGIGGLLIAGRFASVLAPPAGISILRDCGLSKASTWKQYSAVAKWFLNRHCMS